MASESIIALKRPGFPTYSFTEASYTTLIEYVGEQDTLEAASPAKSTAWGDYAGLVASSNLEPLPGTEHAILTVTCERKFDTSGGGTGTKLANETTYEIDWADVQRSMYEHPEFAVGGGGRFQLTDQDVAAIQSWQKNPDVTYKKDFIYREDGDYANGVSSLDETLSANAQKFAKGILLGIEYWIEKVPVARKNDSYVLGPPPAGNAGLKENPIGFPNLPAGYEWIRDSDRALRAGGQTSWTNETSWLGAKKVQVDAKNIYWT